MSEHILKGTLLGGFKRSDVMAYIERSAQENAAAVAALKDELETLRQERDALSEEKNALLEKSGRLDALKEEKDTLAEEVIELHTALSAARQQGEALRQELELLRPEWEEYQSIKAQLSEIQIEACRRASELEESTRRRLQELEDATYDRLQALTDSCRTVYTEAFVAHYPEVFRELEQLLTRPQPEEADGGEAEPYMDDPAPEQAEQE